MPVSLPTLLQASPYLADLNARHGDWLSAALGNPNAALNEELATVAAVGAGNPAETEIATALRRTKARVALLAAAAETTGAWTTADATAALSDLADAALEAGLAVLLQRATEKGDIRAGTTPSNSGLILFALGKHGGRELNYSSDIDIVAFFARSAGAVIEAEEDTKIFSRIVQKLAGLMQDRIGDDYVFRTDLRLRPDPGSTPVAISTDAALAYYESRGQNWERAAWIKARACAGDIRAGEAFLAELAPYIWRKHLDFATITDIQAMKRQINVSKNVGEARVAGHNVKLGRGGIREIEFFAQTQQLIAGGRDTALRVRPTSAALAALARAGWIAEGTATALTRTYWFLRGVENRLQMLRDEQTHVMPETDAGIETIATLMGFSSRAEFEAAYRQALAQVQGYYAELFTEGENLGAEAGDLVFTGSDDDPGTIETLRKMGFHDPSAVSTTIRKWHYGSYAATRAAAARAHLTELLPALLATFARTGNADLAFQRFDNFLGRLPGGVQLFALLRNHAHLRDLLVQLMATAPRMAEAVIHRAHVMDALIDPAFADEVSRSDVLVAKIDAFLGDARDYQEVIDRARIIGQEQQFLIAAGLLSGTVTAQRAGEQFTALAETLLRRLFAAVRAEFEKRHGTLPDASVALLGFGKMASREMTVSSDLDFIMIYDADATMESNGDKPLAASQYFARLTQRLVAAVTAPTSEGVLYNADMRLRPSGNAGPLATSLTAFRVYQEESAWTWEHMALTRARVVDADPGFAPRVSEVIAAVLARPVDRAKVIADVISMRELLSKERPPRHAFDLKLVEGGLVDLEFIAQSAQLTFGAQIAQPQVPVATVLSRLAKLGLVPAGNRLAEIHEVYSTVLQVMSAALVDPFRDEGWTDAFRDVLAQLTNEPSFQRLCEDIDEMRTEVRAAAADWYRRAVAG